MTGTKRAEWCLVNVLEIAMGNGVRTEEQQAALLEMAEGVDALAAPFASWRSQAVETWKAKPCEGGCDRERPIDEPGKWCATCIAEVRIGTAVGS